MDEKECIIRDCSGNPEEQGLCGTHLERVRGKEPLSGIFKRKKADRPCIVKGCVRSSHAKDLCAMHFNRVVRKVALDAPIRVRKDATRQCSIENCTTTVQAKDMCGFHYSRFRKGTPLDGVKRGGEEARGRKLLSPVLLEASFRAWLLPGAPSPVPPWGQHVHPGQGTPENRVHSL